MGKKKGTETMLTTAVDATGDALAQGGVVTQEDPNDDRPDDSVDDKADLGRFGGVVELRSREGKVSRAVVATRRGFYGTKRRYPGDHFEMEFVVRPGQREPRLPSWVVLEKDYVPPPKEPEKRIIRNDG